MKWATADARDHGSGKWRSSLRRTMLLAAVAGSLVLPVLLRANAPAVASKRSAAPDSAQLALKGDAQAGRALFEQRCGVCHGINGGGGHGPNLRKPVLQRAANIVEIAAVIKQGIEPVMPEGWYFSAQDLANLATYVHGLGQTPQAPLPGDPARGQTVFEQAACQSCHILNGRGHGYGPDLSNVGAERGVDRLYQKLTDSRAALVADFLLVEAETASGETIQGIRRNEDTVTIQVQDPSGKFHSLVKSELRSLKRLRGETPMPSFAGALSKQQLDDLVSFLAVQRVDR